MAEPIYETNGNHAPLYPGEPESWWVEGAPLRLLAFALRHYKERNGNVAQIKAVLSPSWVKEGEWDHWWRETRRMAAAESDHFERKGSNGPITLLTEEIANIPASPLPRGRGRRRRQRQEIAYVPVSPPSPSAKKSAPARPGDPPKAQQEWLQWFQDPDKGDAVPPGSVNQVKQVKAARDALNICPTESLGTALQRTLDAAGCFLTADMRPKAVATEWARLLSRAAQLWSNHPDATDNIKTAADVGELMAKLVQVADFPEESARLLRQAGELSDEQREAWRQGFAAGLGKAMPISGDIRTWFDKAFYWMLQEHKARIIREIALAAFAVGAAPVSSAQFPRLGDLPSLPRDAEKSEFFQNLIIRSATGKLPRQNVLDYIAGARNGLTPEARLNTMVLASLLLTDGSGPIVDQAAQGIGRALASDDAAGDAGSPLWEGLLDEARRQFADLRAGLTNEIERQRQHYEEQLEECRREGERLNRQGQRVRAQLEAGREASKLDIRQDMLLVMSETLQGLRQSQDSPEQTLRNVAAGLVLALRAGDAEEFGAVGETVPYDPTRHQSDQTVPLNAVVRITYPGAAVRGKLTGAGDRVILKAQVVLPVEVN